MPCLDVDAWRNVGTPVKILIVDDHPLIREALRHVLLALDAEINLIEAQDFAAALVAADADPDFDLSCSTWDCPTSTASTRCRSCANAIPASRWSCYPQPNNPPS